MGAERNPAANDSAPREGVSELTTTRLSHYLRCLNMVAVEGQRRISSHELANRFDLSSAQIRKDLACFGELGIRGVGYDVESLRLHLRATLGLNVTRNLLIVGAGHLGMALADYDGFNVDGFRTVALIDTDPAKIGSRSRHGLVVEPLERINDLVSEHDVSIGAIAVPVDVAQEICDRIVASGITAIVNFAPVRLRTDDDISVRNVDFRIALETLSFHLARSGDE